LEKYLYVFSKVGVWCNICGKHGFLRFTQKALEREVVVAFTTNTKKCIQFGPWRFLFSRVEILQSGRLTAFLVLKVFWFFSTYSWLWFTGPGWLYILYKIDKVVVYNMVYRISIRRSIVYISISQSFKHGGNVFHYINTLHEVLEFNWTTSTWTTLNQLLKIFRI
jgi:hypothetical protein